MSRKNLQHITLKSIAHLSHEVDKYSDDNLEAVQHLDFVAGIPPFLRGISSTMYVTSPWNIIQSNIYTSSEEYNTFLKHRVKAGQRTFLFDLNTQNETHSLPETLTDFETIFKDIPLDKITILLKNTSYALPILAYYSELADTQGLVLNTIKGGFSIDVLECFSDSEQGYINSVLFSNTILPNFNRIEISGDSLKAKELKPEMELALMLICGVTYIQKGLDLGLQIDDIATRLSFNFSIGMQHFTEIAKLRAARLLWAKIVTAYQPQSNASSALQIHCTTQHFDTVDDYDVLAKSTIGAAAAVFAGTQDLQIQTTNTVNVESQNIHAFLKAETQITKTVDPWAGSYYVEKETHELALNTWKLIEEFQKTGDIPEDIQSELATYKSATIPHTDSLKNGPSDRDEKAVSRALMNLEVDLKHNRNTVLKSTITAVKNQATLSEIVKLLN
ncbi:methylmalonyl-CoA mutase family protein [Formosa algae]|uniref:methylmalonyl-CoA mutase family protein n=1 Tax=Formosa algae TaxID=225843 RepID=UPI000CCE1FA6|nr:methylmalonyl-CoA mutase family protein [Formosa algae]PNW29736.1 hypothetical protein BKP44_03310 [Formosa algae]